MKITITEAAAKKISERTMGRQGFLKLKYDMEGCGCAVDGIIALWFVPDLDKYDVLIETNDRPVYIENDKTIFFDEQMKIDFSPASNCFVLQSPQQIINGRMSMIKKAD